LKIRAVLFDMGGTLITFDGVHPGEVFQRILISLGISSSLDEIKRAFLNAEKEAKELDLLSLIGKMKREEYWLKWDSLVLKHLSIPEGKELAKVVQSKWSDHVNCTSYPEAKMVLSKLKQKKLALGLISNAYEEEINRVLEEANLEKRTFDIIVGVDTVQNMKPHPDIFNYALEKLKVRPEETWFIGDNIEADYEGAEKVGTRAFLIKRKEAEGMKEIGLRTITNLKDIFRHIE
jgi:putative hydrolase of the HAD superfamily